MIGFLHSEPVMATAKLLRGKWRYFTWNYLGRLILAVTMLATTLFTVCTTFLRRNEYLMTRSDFVRSLETSSTGRLQRYIRDQRGKEPNVLRF